MSDAQQPPPAPSTALNSVYPPQMTPRGTTIIVPASPGQPQQTVTIPPELVSAFHGALASMPPDTISVLLQKYWRWIAAAALPLALATYTNLKQIWEGPATVAAIKQEYVTDHVAVEANVKAIEAVKVQIEALQKKAEGTEEKVDKMAEKVDRILWSVTKPPTEPHP